MDIKIREATGDDLSYILSIYSQRNMDSGNVLSTKDAKVVLSKIGKYPNYKVYCAIADGCVVGTFALLIMDNLAHMGRSSGIIEDMAVAESWQRRGVGRKMVNFANDRCTENGCYKIMVSSNISRNSAHAFYEAVGFKKHGYSYIIDII